MKGFIQFIQTKIFLKHILSASALALFVLWCSFQLIAYYTDHGSSIAVPDFTGKSIGELDDFIAGKNVRYEIIDSVYAPKEKPGIVIRQEPEKESEVKHNRIVYLYVTSVLPPQIVMPKLVDRSLRQATSMIESYGLKLGTPKFVPDPCSNCILRQLYKGQDIAPGTMIKKGSVIDLYVGKGSGNAEQAAVPSLIGLKYCEAKRKIQAASLSIGALVFDAPVKDSCSAYIYRQIPANSAGNLVPLGAGIDLYLTTDKSKLELLNSNNNNDDNNNDPEK